VEKIIHKILEESIRIKKDFIEKNISKIIFLAKKIADAFSNGRKLLICGNGGSAADSQHIAAEFINRFRIERRPLPAIALTTDTSVITSIANDYSFDRIFSKQIEAIGKTGDILLAISTSGESENVIQAVLSAKKMGIYTSAFTGKDGGRLLKIADLSLKVESSETERIQEVHIMTAHIICHLVEVLLFEER